MRNQIELHSPQLFILAVVTATIISVSEDYEKFIFLAK